MTSPLPSYVALGLAPTWPLCRTPLHSPAKTPSWVDQPRNMHQKQTPLLLSRDFGWLPPLALVSWSLFHFRRRCFGLELLVKAQVHTTADLHTGQRCPDPTQGTSLGALIVGSGRACEPLDALGC